MCSERNSFAPFGAPKTPRQNAQKNSLDAYDYELPPERIAQEPAAQRDASRLLVLDRGGGGVSLGLFPDLIERLRAGDLLVLNDARVIPARFPARRGGGGKGELLLLEPRREAGNHGDAAAAGRAAEPSAWEALIRPARWARALARRRGAIDLAGDLAGAAGVEVRAEVIAELGGGRFAVVLRRGERALSPGEVIALCEQAGEVPLPPYIRRAPGDPRRPADRERYQTVYARVPVAAAAPTAGLHFTPGLLERLRERGVEQVRITHQIGIGTFLPLRAADLDRQTLHSEESAIDAESGGRILAARREGRRIVAVGTTVARALESFAIAGMPLPYRARTELFIRPGHRFRLVDALVTNFHLPRSSLLLLVSAFAGRERILDAYRQAIAAGFRFYSYGDAMLIL